MDALLKKIRLVIFDVDGVLTNGQIIHTNHGDEIKAFHVHDGLGMKWLQEMGITVGIITSRSSDIVDKRMRELHITHVYQGQKHKVKAYENLIQSLNLKEEEVAYVGDDMPDLTLIKRVGMGIAVANAHPVLIENAKWVTEKKGGKGAAREVCEAILKAQGHWPLILEKYQ